MSDDVLKIIPAAQDYVPEARGQQQAVEMLKKLCPDGEMCEAKTYEELQFIDQGANMEAVVCPSCGKRLPIDHLTENDPGVAWWDEVQGVLATKSLAEFETTMPCCGATVPFTSLKFDWPAGFARFELAIWNPNIGRDLSPEELRRLQSVLGCELSQIWAHY